MRSPRSPAALARADARPASAPPGVSLHDLVPGSGLNSPLDHHELQELQHVARVHLAGVIGQLRRQIDRPQDRARRGRQPFRPARSARSCRRARPPDPRSPNRAPCRHHLARDQQRRLLAGNRGGGDHHVLFLEYRGHLLALPANGLLARAPRRSRPGPPPSGPASMLTNFAPRLSICSFTASRTS